MPMSEIINGSLQQIAKGTGIIFIGTMIGSLLAFIGRIILVRFVSQSEYGIYSLAFTILGIFVMISTLGLGDGLTRHIAYYKGKGDETKVSTIIFLSIKIVLVTSIFIGTISLLTSDFISANIFKSPELSMPLKIISISIPFIVLINIFVAITRGFGIVNVKIYFQDLLKSILSLLFLIIAVLLKLSFIGVVYAIVLSSITTCLIFAAYMAKKYLLPMRKNVVSEPMTKELLSFSIPLLAVSMLMMVLSWTDTLMLGYLTTPDIVGLYSVALPLAMLLSMIITSMSFIYIPIIAKLYSQNLIYELKKTYAILTKWVFLISSIIFFILIVFPDIVLDILFGSRYISASVALQILAFGFFMNICLGFAYNTLLVLGKSKFLMWTFAISAIINIILNMILIPLMGFIGASIATAVSIIIAKVLNAIELYRFFNIHPFSKNYIKLVGLLIVFIFVFYILRNLVIMSFFAAVALFLLFLVSYGFSIVFIKSFDSEDIMILLAIEKRLGVNLTTLKKILKPWM